MAPSSSKCCRERSTNGRSMKKNVTMVSLPAKVPRPERDSEERVCGGQMIHRPFPHSATEFVQRLEWLLFQLTEGKLSRTVTLQVGRAILKGEPKNTVLNLLTNSGLANAKAQNSFAWIYSRTAGDGAFQLVERMTFCYCENKTCCSGMHRGDCGSCLPRGPYRFGPIACDYTCTRFNSKSKYWKCLYENELAKLDRNLKEASNDASVAAVPSSACTSERRQG